MRLHLSCVLLLIFTVGCNPHKNPPVSYKQVTLTELERETKDLVYFNYLGGDDGFEYFSTPDGRQYKLPIAESDFRKRLLPGMPHLKPDQGAALFVKITDGKLRLPDPEKMRQLFGMRE